MASTNRYFTHNYIMPIFGVRDDNYIEEFLGTSIFVGRPPILVTANHVINDWNGPIAILLTTPSMHRVMRAKVIHSKSDVDLSLLEVPEYPLKEGVQLANDEELVNNKFVLCNEYSQTQFEKNKRELDIQPSTRMGNVTRFRDLQDRYGKAGELALELSFPAFMGASGAPVLSAENLHLWGIIKSNIDYHLIPVQTIIMKDENTKRIEETSYMMPQAIAIHVKHLREMLREIGHP